jgi:3-hydroxybutyrate dehydrogenase
MSDMQGIVCVVTGGGSIGTASAQVLLEAGAHVHLVDRDAALLKAVARMLAAYAGRVDRTVADGSDAEQTRGYSPRQFPPAEG